MNESLSQITAHNFSILQKQNITCYAGDGLEYIKKHSAPDWIYVDPARRDDHQKKVFFLSDCTPNIPKNQDLLFRHSNNILLKASPLLDITSGIQELKYVKSVHIVSVKNECKELLFVMEKGFVGKITIHAIHITEDTIQRFAFEMHQDTKPPKYELPQQFLYEPNASIMKSGGFQQLANKLSISKLHQHSHLFTSENLMEEFPGRKFKIVKVLKYDKKTLRNFLPDNKANISTRNFYSSVNQIRKKTGIKEGGEVYLFFTTDKNNKAIVIACYKA